MKNSNENRQSCRKHDEWHDHTSNVRCRPYAVDFSPKKHNISSKNIIQVIITEESNYTCFLNKKLLLKSEKKIIICYMHNCYRNNYLYINCRFCFTT